MHLNVYLGSDYVHRRQKIFNNNNIRNFHKGLKLTRGGGLFRLGATSSFSDPLLENAYLQSTTCFGLTGHLQVCITKVTAWLQCGLQTRFYMTKLRVITETPRWPLDKKREEVYCKPL
jgi:hypothetical protein